MDKIVEHNKKLLDAVIPFDKLPKGLKEFTFEYLTFRRELTKESDRGCALLAAAHLDYMLNRLLRKKLLGSKNHFEALFGVTGPLGTFSSKILLTYSLGLISSNELHDIQIIRKIRNEFGHTSEIIIFDTPRIKAFCNNLKLNVYDNANPRDIFLSVVSAISGGIEGSTIKGRRFHKHKEENLEDRKNNINKILDLTREFVDSTWL